MTNEKLVEELFHIAYYNGVMDKLREKSIEIHKEMKTPMETAIPIAFNMLKTEGLIQDDE
jgi:hypothetical protein